MHATCGMWKPIYWIRAILRSKRMGKKSPAESKNSSGSISWRIDPSAVVRFAYKWHDYSGNWFRSFGNENWEFDEGLKSCYAQWEDVGPIRQDMCSVMNVRRRMLTAE